MQSPGYPLPMQARVTFLALSFALSFSMPARAANGVRCSFYGIDPGAPSDGRQVILDAAYADQLASAGAGAVRVEFQLPSSGSWSAGDLATYDTIINAIGAAGLQPLGLLSDRTVPAGQADWNDDPDGDGDNDYVHAFAETSKVLFSHFSGRVARWEIWSQPNCFTDPAYASDPQNAGCTYLLPRVFARMLGAVYTENQALFQANKVSLVTGGLLASEDAASPSGVDYLVELYAQPWWTQFQAGSGRRYPWAYLGYQLFIDQFQETDGVNLGGYLDSVREVAAQYGDESRFYITGVAWTTGAGFINEEVQAANLTTSIGYFSKRPDVAAAYWYGYKDDPLNDSEYGLVTETGAPKAALSAMRGVAKGCEADSTSSSGSGGTGSGAGGVTPGTSGGAKPGPYETGPRESSCSHAATPAPARPGGMVSGLALLASAALLVRSSRSRTARRVT